MNGAWVMSNGAIQKVRKFVDLNGQYLWQPALQPAGPDTFDGQAVFEDPNLATPASATKSVIYGELSLWTIKQRPIRVAVSSDYQFNLDNINIKSVYRAGGALPDAVGLAQWWAPTRNPLMEPGRDAGPPRAPAAFWH